MTNLNPLAFVTFLRVPALLGCLVLTPALPTIAQMLPSGTYRATAELGSVMLDGRYPLVLDQMSGLLEVGASPTGALTGRIVAFGQTFDVTGQSTARQGYHRVVLRSAVASQRVLLKARLEGGDFVGTLKIHKLVVPCRFDATTTGPIRAEYLLSLAVEPDGRMTGDGTISSARQKFPVKLHGRVKDGDFSLRLEDGKTFLKATGKIVGAGFTAAKWTAQGFGAARKGTNLQFTPVVQ